MSNKVEATFHPDGPPKPSVIEVLRGHGVDGGIHSWRCGSPERFPGRSCSCVEDLAAALVDAMPAPEVLGYTVMAIEGNERPRVVDSIFTHHASAEGRATWMRQVDAGMQNRPRTYRVVQLVGVRGEGK